MLKLGDVLIVTVQAALTDAELIDLRTELADRVGRLRSKGVVVDVSLLDVLDSFASRTLEGVDTAVDRDEAMEILGRTT